MLYAIANVLTEDVEDDLAKHKEEHPKRNMSERPPVLQSVCHENDLHYHVHKQADAVEDVEHHEQTNRVLRSEPGLILECQDRHGTRDDEHANRTSSNQPYRLPSTVFIQLEAHEAVDQQASAKR